MATADTVAQPAAPVKTAKLFKNGRSQAVRLPKKSRVQSADVEIRRDAATGEVLLTPALAPSSPVKSLQELLDLFNSRNLSMEDFECEVRKLGKLTLQELFLLFDWAEFPEGFFQREVHTPRELDLF